jgi:hypothetical protein
MGLSLEQLTGLLGGGTPDLSALIGAAGHTDPTLSAVLGALAQQRSAAADADSADGAENEAADASARDAELRARFEHLRDVARRMDGELRVLRRRNAQLAAALGACPHCWGEDAECGTCAGEGVPGSAPSHRGHWLHYVAASASPAQRAARATTPFPRVIAGIPGASQD